MALKLACRSVGFCYGNQTVLADISFGLETGRFYTLLGANGSGKTTLLHCLNRILTPVTGQITLKGKDLSDLSSRAIARNISLVPQEHLDMFPYRVLDVVTMGRAPFLRGFSTPDTVDYEIARRSLGELGAEKLADLNFNRISGGERQMVLLARALTQAGDIMLLDEPTNHLDFKNQYRLMSCIKNLCKNRGITAVAAVHDPNMAALFADDVIMLKQGGVFKKGSTARIMTEENIAALYETDTVEIGISGRKIFMPTHILKGE